MRASRDRVVPLPGQESVWDYPRPPACVPSSRQVVVTLGDQVIAETRDAYRILETSHPPTWYLPPAAFASGVVGRSDARSTFCEWKGSATYWDIVAADGRVLKATAWSYETPTAGYEAIAGYLGVSAARFVCTVDGERVRPQEGGFYAGWITDDVVGPFKGPPGTLGW